VAGEAPQPFIAVFAVFFPAVTGFTQGVSMSGDLRDPRRSLPVGTFAAMGVGVAVYVGLLVYAALMASPAQLRDLDEIVFKSLAAVPWLVTLGICGATLSSALGSVLGAPRILQALAQDGVVPRLLARGHGPTRMPRLATLVALAIALTGVALAYTSPSGLNAIAGVITMFFLASYGFISLACGLATWARTPSFRPSFRVPAPVSLAGAGGCFYVMSLINLPAMLASVLIVGLIYVALTRRQLTKTWGDLRHGLWAALIRRGLDALRSVPYHPLNWQPHLMVLGGSPLQRPHLLQLGHWVAGQRGLVTYFFLIPGELEQEAGKLRAREATLQKRLARDYPNVFTRVQICEDLFPEALTAVQAHGLPGFAPNTVLVGWSRDPEAAEEYTRMLSGLVALDKCLLLLSHQPRCGFGRRREIELWWGGLQHNGGLMMLLAALIRESEHWKDARVTVRMIADPDQKPELLQANLERIIEEARLPATAEVIVSGADANANADAKADADASADAKADADAKGGAEAKADADAKGGAEANAGADANAGAEANANANANVPDDPDAPDTPATSPLDIIAARSRGDLVLLGLRPPAEGEAAADFVARVNALVDRLPTCLLVKAGSDFESPEMLFEQEYTPKRRRAPRTAPVFEADEADLEASPHPLEGQGQRREK